MNRKRRSYMGLRALVLVYRNNIVKSSKNCKCCRAMNIMCIVYIMYTPQLNVSLFVNCELKAEKHGLSFCIAVLNSSLLYFTARYCAVLHCDTALVLYLWLQCNELYRTVLHICTVLCCNSCWIIKYCTELLYTVL